MLDAPWTSNRVPCGSLSHNGVKLKQPRSGEGRWAPALSALALAALTAVAAGCGSAGESPDAWGDGDVITGAGGGPGGLATSGSGAGNGGAPSSQKLGPPYPVVLAHGFFGFEDFAGVDFITYFYNVKNTLAADGETIFTPAVDPFNNSTVRGAQLLAQIEQIVATTGAEKVNIIAHSQGGLDARYVAHERPDLVASVVTIATPHNGSAVADVALRIVSNPNAQAIVDDLVRAIGAPLYDTVGNETSVAESLRQLSSPGAAAFNEAYPDAPGVYYASFGGRTDHATGGADCLTVEEAPFLVEFDADLDPVHPLLSLTETILDGGFGHSNPNDGLVLARDARWGHFWGCIPADHFDEIGQLFGQSPGEGNNWKYIDFYRAIIERLRREGL